MSIYVCRPYAFEVLNSHALLIVLRSDALFFDVSGCCHIWSILTNALLFRGESVSVVERLSVIAVVDMMWHTITVPKSGHLHLNHL